MKRMVWNREHSRLVYRLRATDRRMKGSHLWAIVIAAHPHGPFCRSVTITRRRRDVQRRARG